MNSLLAIDRTDELPKEILSRVGHIFATFDARTQDSGNVSYGVEIDGSRYFVKTAGMPDDPLPFLTHTQRVELLRNGARVARSCNDPLLPALLAVIESPVGPMLVYEWVEGELLGAPRNERDDPSSAYQRFRRLPVETIVRALHELYRLHAELAGAGWVAVDFYDGSLIYDFMNDRLRVVDIDHYHWGAFTNTMGRMFGSTRFMAPEEFELGATIDERTTIFTMGRTAAVFLSDGTLDRDPFRGNDALHRVVMTACDPDRDRRFPTVAALVDAWQMATRD